MTLYIHTYTNESGEFSDESCITQSRDDAMRWLDFYHDGMVHGGYKYHCTYLIMDQIADRSMCYRQNLLVELDEWRVEMIRAEQLDWEHDRAVRSGVRDSWV